MLLKMAIMLLIMLKLVLLCYYLRKSDQSISRLQTAIMLLIMLVEVVDGTVKCDGCGNKFDAEVCRVNADAVKSFCSDCEGGAAHQRWKRVNQLKHDQVRHVRNMLMVMKSL